MIDMRYKPYFLPQVNMPFQLVLAELVKEGIGYEIMKVDPNDLKTSQGVTFSDEVGGVKPSDDKPIWVDMNMQVLDGHHRWVRALLDGELILVIKLKMEAKDACRLLNRISDLHEFKQTQELEEVVAQDMINVDNDAKAGVSDNEFLAMMENDNSTLQAEKPSTNQKKLVAYRKDEIRENSTIGNFFMLKPENGYTKYEIEFDNILDANSLGLTAKDGQLPVEMLAKIWFPNINFEKLSEQYQIPVINLQAKAITKRAMNMGYDGIKYSDKLIQGLM